MRWTAGRGALTIALLYIVLVLVYAGSTPLFEAPDEAAHFLYSHNLLETGRLPVIEGRRAMFASKAVQRHHPPLYYLAGAVLIAPTQRADVADYLVDNPFAANGFVSVNNNNLYLHNPPRTSDTNSAAWTLRLYSLALATGTLWLIYRVGDLVVPGERRGLLAMLTAALLPGFIASGGSINNDNLVTFLFAAGVYGCLRVWRRGAITRPELIAFSLIFPAAALTKLTGLTLLPLVCAALLLSGLRGDIPLWRSREAGRYSVASFIVVTVGATVLLAGWWYVRNWQLYGDPLALAATRSVWGRGPLLSVTPAQIWLEAKGIWESFWLVLGHLSIRAGDPFYVYTVIFTGGALAGLLWRLVQLRRALLTRGRGLLLLLAVVALVTGSLVLATRQVNISQGRLLYPALVGFAPLLALGWTTLLGRFAPVLLLPLALAAVLTPPLYLQPAFTPARPVTDLPADIQPVNATAEGLTLHGVRLPRDPVAPGAVVALEVYFGGQHADNPAFFVTALDPASGATFGGVDLYPGMAATDWLEPDVIYRAPVRFWLDPATTNQRPVQLALAVGWRVPERDDDPARFLDWRSADGAPIDLLTLTGPLLIDPTYAPEPLTHPADVTFADALVLEGYAVPDTVAPGEPLPVTLRWTTRAAPPDDYTLTVGLVDAAGTLVAQADAPPPAYPTSAWLPGVPFQHERALSLPAVIAPGTYRVYVGWYTTPDIVRLPARGDPVENDLYFLPTPVRVVALSAG